MPIAGIEGHPRPGRPEASPSGGGRAIRPQATFLKTVTPSTPSTAKITRKMKNSTLAMSAAPRRRRRSRRSPRCRRSPGRRRPTSTDPSARISGRGPRRRARSRTPGRPPPARLGRLPCRSRAEADRAPRQARETRRRSTRRRSTGRRPVDRLCLDGTGPTSVARFAGQRSRSGPPGAPTEAEADQPGPAEAGHRQVGARAPPSPWGLQANWTDSEIQLSKVPPGDCREVRP